MIFDPNTHPTLSVNPTPLRYYFSLALVALALACLAYSLIPGAPGGAVAGKLQLVLIMAYALIHASIAHGWRGAGSFFAIALIVSFILEATSIAIGFPFGHFQHNTSGPRLLEVPLHIPLSYATLGWIAWCISCLIVRRSPSSASSPTERLATPIVAAFVFTGFDFAFDPIGATIDQAWTFQYPGGYFGVPISNFLGWLLTCWIFFQLFAFTERHLARTSPLVHKASFWTLPCIAWMTMALSFIPRYINAPQGIIVLGERSYLIADIYETTLIAALMAIFLPALCALVRVFPSAPPS